MSSSGYSKLRLLVSTIILAGLDHDHPAQIVIPNHDDLVPGCRIRQFALYFPVAAGAGVD